MFCDEHLCNGMVVMNMSTSKPKSVLHFKWVLALTETKQHKIIEIIFEPIILCSDMYRVTGCSAFVKSLIV